MFTRNEEEKGYYLGSFIVTYIIVFVEHSFCAAGFTDIVTFTDWERDGGIRSSVD